MAEYASNAKGNVGVALGSVGTGLGVLGSVILGGLFNPRMYGMNGCGCNEDHFVNRYEAQKNSEIATLQMENALLKSDKYTDEKSIELYKYVDGRFREFEQAFAAQAVNNQKTADDVMRVQANLDCCCKELRDKICDEKHERKCNDNLIVTYANATFYPKLIAGITAGTTTTPQPTFNPIPQGTDCCCGN